MGKVQEPRGVQGIQMLSYLVIDTFGERGGGGRTALLPGPFNAAE